MKKMMTALVSTLIFSGAFAQTPAATATGTMPAVSAMSKSVSATPAAKAKSDAKRDAANEKHITDLHAKLKITTEQETLWDNVAKTMRESAGDMDKAIDIRESSIAISTAVDDLNAYAAIAQVHADSVKKLSTAFGPLYAAMPDAQKKLADDVFTQREHAGKRKHAASK